MKNLIIAMLMSCPFISHAQKDSYDIHITEDPLEKAYGNKFPGYYITKDGSRTDCLILFEEGDKMANPGNMLSTSTAYASANKGIDKGMLVAFFVNERLYVPGVIEDKSLWIHLSKQGAIHHLGYCFYFPEQVDRKLELRWDAEKQVNVAYWDTLSVSPAHWVETDYIQKLDGPAEAPLLISKNKVQEYVADYADLATKIENKEKGYKPSLIGAATNTTGGDEFPDRMFTIYNAWYDENNPGAITYYPTEATFKSPDSPPVAQGVGTDAAVSTVVVAEAADSEMPYHATRVDPFASRPIEAPAAVASAKPEVAVKKETFVDRINRIKADGNKVGVYVSSKYLLINPGTFAEGISPAQITGSYEPLSGLDLLAKATTDQLNAGFGTDVFEVVDISQIPYKEGSYGNYDDWWATKYKLIVMYEVEPYYNAYTMTNTGTGESEFKALMKVVTELIVMAAEDDKPGKLKYETNSPKSMGYYMSEPYVGPPSADVRFIQDLKKLINPPSDKEVVEALISSQKEDIDKFISKQSK